MSFFYLIFPLIFIFHDMEEIIGMRYFLLNKREKIEKVFPEMMKIYENFSTEAFAVAVYEELLVCILISTAAVFTGNRVVVLLWIGAFAGCIFHFVIHIVQSIAIRTYVPALITSCICLPISIWVIVKCIETIDGFDIANTVICLLGAILVFINLAFAHRIMKWFSKHYEC